MKRITYSLTFLCTSLFFQASGEHFLPVVLLHGINSSAYYMRECSRIIQEHLGPDVYVYDIEIGTGKLSSFWNIIDQCAEFAWKIRTDPLLIHGFNLVAHSQGGLIARNYIQEYNLDPDSPHVYNFITIGSPHQGVFGTPGTMDEKFTWLNHLETYAYYVLYSAFFQKFFSFPQYWHDTCHYKEYLAYCQFLPYLNNELDHKKSALYKNNLCSLDNFVLIQSNCEEIIEPADSCHFSFYARNCTNTIENLFATAWYQDDTLGLRTLYESKRMHLKFASTDHSGMTSDLDNIKNNIVPFLTLPRTEPVKTSHHYALALLHKS